MDVPQIIGLDGPARVGSGQAFVVFVRLSMAAQRVTPIQIGCSHAGVVTNPYKAWPMTMLLPTGHDSLSVPVYSHNVTRATEVRLYACESGVDAAVPVNWRASLTLTVEPPSVSEL